MNMIMNKLQGKFSRKVSSFVVKMVGKWMLLTRSEFGGVSPIVVVLGMALIFLAIILFISPTLRTSIEALFQKIIDGLNGL